MALYIPTHIPYAEQVRNGDIGQDKNATTANTLDCSACDYHSRVLRQSTYQAAEEKEEVRKQDNWPSPPDITALAPKRNRCRIAQEISRGNP